MDHVTTPDGLHLEVLTSGPEDGYPLVYHGGTPSAAVPFPPLERALDDAHLRLVMYPRPGYGTSKPRPRREAAWQVADDVTDTVATLDELSLGEFVTLGWSGGGPRALACAALLPGRCRADLSLAGVAPHDADCLDFTAGMGPENVRDFTAAESGREALRPFIEAQVDEMAHVTSAEVVGAFGELVDEVDAGALTGEIAEYLAGCPRPALRRRGPHHAVGTGRRDARRAARDGGSRLER